MGAGTEQTVANARRHHEAALEALQKAQATMATAERPGLPAPSQQELKVTAARAELSVAMAMLDKTRIRAPAAGTVLKVYTRAGEIVAFSPEAPVALLGDISSMRVKAEVDEAYVRDIKIGQKVVVRSLSYPDGRFEGTVVDIASAVAPPRLGQRGPRRPTDVQVLEVTVNLDGNVPLITGMRVDVHFRPQD